MPATEVNNARTIPGRLVVDRKRAGRREFRAFLGKSAGGSSLLSSLFLPVRVGEWGRRALVVLSVIAFSCCALQARAAEGDEFYRGKQITFIVGAGPGAYDVYARVIAPFLGQHIPGKPTVIVSNMDGAASLRAAGYMANIAPRDGTVIAMTLNDIPTAPQLVAAGVNFDPTKLSWIGSMTREPFVGYVWHTSPIRTVTDTLNRETTMGATQPGAAGADFAVIAKTFFGMKLKLVMGYPDTTAIKLAMERGEVEGTFANIYSDVKSSRPQWIRDGLIRIIVQYGRTRSKDLPNVPSIYEFTKNDEQRASLDLMLARQAFAKPVFAPPGVPAARLEMLRRAFDETIRDPAFLDAAAKARLPIDQPMTGEELTAAVNDLAKTPPEVGAKLRALLANYK